MMSVDLKPSYLVATTAGALVAAGVYLYKKQKEKQIPTKWKVVAKVKHLYLYPLKSGQAIEIDQVDCTSFGFQQVGNNDGSFKLRDRCFVVYNETSKGFLTARRYPKMVLISVTEHVALENHVAFDAPGMRTLYVKVPSLHEDIDRATSVIMWEKEQATTLDCGDEAANWFSRYILESESGVRLGYYPGHKRRDITKSQANFIKAYNNLSNESTGMFSDLTSYTIINEASIEDLNSRLENPVSHKNFRPNIVIEGNNAPAFAEDQWSWVKVGDVILRKVVPSTRCIFTTIDPETGIKSSEKEPLKTLESYRLLGKHLNINNFKANSTVMGIHLELKKAGRIFADDEVYIPE